MRGCEHFATMVPTCRIDISDCICEPNALTHHRLRLSEHCRARLRERVVGTNGTQRGNIRPKTLPDHGDHLVVGFFCHDEGSDALPNGLRDLVIFVQNVFVESLEDVAKLLVPGSILQPSALPATGSLRLSQGGKVNGAEELPDRSGAFVVQLIVQFGCLRCVPVGPLLVLCFGDLFDRDGLPALRIVDGVTVKSGECQTVFVEDTLRTLVRDDEPRCGDDPESLRREVCELVYRLNLKYTHIAADVFCDKFGDIRHRTLVVDGLPFGGLI